MRNIFGKIFAGSVIVVTTMMAAASVSAQAKYAAVGADEKMKLKGIIVARSEESFKMSSLDGQHWYTVLITPDSEVRAHRTGVFRGNKEYESTYLLRGLRVEVEGRGNSDGQLVARTVRFDDQDLRTAQALQARVDPIEEQVGSNTKRIESGETRLTAAEENAKRMSGQIDENTALAKNAQGSADAAMAEATRANTRINGLDEYDPIKTITVLFATGSSTLGPKGRQTIDEAAAWVKTQDRKGWMVSVVGYADSTGNTAKNKALSERRANAVIGYLVSKHGLPITKLVQPFGAGVDDPAATNETAAGRTQNRRVEINLIKNRGIGG